VRAVRQSEKPDKKIYRLSSRGVKELKKWIAEEAHFPACQGCAFDKNFCGPFGAAGCVDECPRKGGNSSKKATKTVPRNHERPLY
jgi:hypothetical protein